ncbi:DNA (cytosine-5-)-methyltransferase [Spirulina subsalsa FACHB-351]|uniref:Cytosine-specific methyltransferase n=1 Tax=Spirulina subsalsa FACHB-351 TaxID=234711 RepID=A0ABT3L202_9CYAN|nr:DNA (cytosine-5-)-methyltransferase [Spirulina subsalsa]MCW6035533.1 DNA (cytosine-5-)-methyltransferase [Spirulina subsalsa FACHB-351]
MVQTLRFIDLFAGLGGMRIGLEKACTSLQIKSHCVFTSEIKSSALAVYSQYFLDQTIAGDISQIPSQEIPNFDILLAGFPCQPFSSAGTRQGFLDTRGTLFFEIQRILKAKKPLGFLLENVEGLAKHDQGRTLKTILYCLQSLGYQVTWKVLNSQDFGVAQNRKRIYIVGLQQSVISWDFPPYFPKRLSDILDREQPLLNNAFTQLLLSHYPLEELQGKAIKDKRGGQDNIHSWDLELKGSVSPEQKQVLNLLLKQRRRKVWSAKKGIQWMDGIPLTVEEINSFYPHPTLSTLLDDLVEKGYLKYEQPKDIQSIVNSEGNIVKKRLYREDLAKGYNIVVGKLSFPITKILHPHDVTPTLVATDMQKLAVVDGKGLRYLTIREGLRLFGFPEDYQINLPPEKAYDLLGNTVVIPVIEAIVQKMLVMLL